MDEHLLGLSASSDQVTFCVLLPQQVCRGRGWAPGAGDSIPATIRRLCHDPSALVGFIIRSFPLVCDSELVLNLFLGLESQRGLSPGC